MVGAMGLVVGAVVGYELGQPRPTTYAACILEHMKPGLTTVAVRDIRQACAATTDTLATRRAAIRATLRDLADTAQAR